MIRKTVMHSLAIFFGVLIFGWGATGLRIALFIVKMPNDDDGPFESFVDRWAPHLVAAIMLPLPIGLFIGGGSLVWWGFSWAN